MRCDSAGNLCFFPVPQMFTQNEELEFRPLAGERYLPGFLQVMTVYDVGFLETDRGYRVRALRPKFETARINLLSQQKGLVKSFPSFEGAVLELRLPPRDIVPGYNCHGFTFGNSDYWINDHQIDALLEGDGYVEVAEI